MLDDPVGRLGLLAARTSCPACRAHPLEFVLRCDLSYGSCLYTARCEACHTSFEIVSGPGEPSAREISAAVAPCPTCGSRERQPSLHCELQPRQCVYTLHCPYCAPQGEATA